MFIQKQAGFLLADPFVSEFFDDGFFDVLAVSSVLGDSLFRLEYCRDRSDTSLSFC